MKALQDRCVTKEGAIAHFHKRIKLLTNEEKQYKEAICCLNEEVKELKGKLEEEGRQKKGEQEAKKKVEKELTAFLEQVETAKADAVVEYKASQSFIVSCGGYYGVGFEDCLKQAKSLYPHLDFSKVTMDEPMPSTPAGDIIQEETDDSTESRLKDDSVVLAQLATDAPITSLVPLTEPKIVEDLVARDKADGNSPNPIVS